MRTLVVLVALASPVLAQNSWTPTSDPGPNNARSLHAMTAFPDPATGATRMFVAGGFEATSADFLIYDPSADAWSTPAALNQPVDAFELTAVWDPDDGRVILFGGQSLTFTPGGSGGSEIPGLALWDPSTDQWQVGSTSGISPRYRHRAIMIDDGSGNRKMLVWGGRSYLNGLPGGPLNDGGIYDAATDTWASLPPSGIAPRTGHSVVQVGTKILVFGGQGGPTTFDDGAIYDLATGQWSSLPSNPGVGPRHGHLAYRIGDRMFLWGGRNGNGTIHNDGWYFDPDTLQWTASANTDAPQPRMNFAHVSTDNGSVAIWGGSAPNPAGGSALFFDTGAMYDPSIDAWISMTATDAPPGRGYATAGWDPVEQRLVVWGGMILTPTPIGPLVTALDSGGVFEAPPTGGSTTTTSGGGGTTGGFGSNRENDNGDGCSAAAGTGNVLPLLLLLVLYGFRCSRKNRVISL